jgi:hypothetical protein
MVRIKRSYRIRVCGTKIRPTWRAPLGFSTDRPNTEPNLNAKSPVQFIVAPRAQVSRRGETQAPLGGKPAKLCYRFGPLTSSARSANLIAGNGTKNGFPAPNKEPTTNQKRRLDRKSPIRVRIRIPPAESPLRTWFTHQSGTSFRTPLAWRQSQYDDGAYHDHSRRQSSNTRIILLCQGRRILVVAALSRAWNAGVAPARPECRSALQAAARPWPGAAQYLRRCGVAVFSPRRRVRC